MTKRSSPPQRATPPKRSVKDAVALLEDREFQAALAAYDAATVRLREAPDRDAQTASLTTEFQSRWGVIPPLDPALRFPTETALRWQEIRGGHWAVIPVFRSTSRADVLAAWRRFDAMETRRQVATEDYRRRAIATWLFESDYTYAEIARDHYGLKVSAGRDQVRTWSRAAPDKADRQAEKNRHRDQVRQEIARYEREAARGLKERKHRRPASDPRAATLTRLLRLVWTQPPERLDGAELYQALDDVRRALLTEEPPPP